MNSFSLSGLILALTCFFLVIVSECNRKNNLHKIWSLFNTSVGLWGIGSFFIGKITDPFLALSVWRLTEISVVFIAVFFLHVTYIICDVKNKFLIYFVYFQGIIFCILSLFSGSFFSGVKLVFNSFYYAMPGAMFFLFFFVWMSIVGYSQYLLFYSILRFKGKKRNQILYFGLGTILGFSGGLTNFFPHFGINFYPFGNFTIPLYCLIITYAIFRYHLLDISIILTRTGIFVAVYTLVLGLPFLLGFSLKDQLIILLGQNWWIIPLISSTFLATAGPFIYLYIDKKAEDRLLKEQRSYQNILRSASSGMIRIKDLKRLLSLIVHVVTKTVRIKHASVYLFDNEDNKYFLQAARGLNGSVEKINIIEINSLLIQQLKFQKELIIVEEEVMKLRDNPQSVNLANFVEQLISLNASLVVPSFVDDKLTGILILGEKLSGKLYSEDDLNIFTVLANQAALAIENAQFYDEIKKTHEQLFQAEKMATIGTMADGLSHQINNRFHALSLIAGDSLDLLKTYDMSACNDGTKEVLSDVKNALERIETNVLQGGEVVKGLLKYSRPGESGFEAVDFKTVLNGAIDMVQYKIKLKEIDLIQNIPATPPKIYGNLTQLQEVFFNMIDNAYDAIKERQIILKEANFRGTIEVSAIEADGSLVITVSDNGMGIKDLDRKKLFTPFFTTKATSRKGTGLGLYVIEKIISAHKGKINIYSIYQSGTRFTIALPLSKNS